MEKAGCVACLVVEKPEECLGTDLEQPDDTVESRHDILIYNVHGSGAVVISRVRASTSRRVNLAELTRSVDHLGNQKNIDCSLHLY